MGVKLPVLLNTKITYLIGLLSIGSILACSISACTSAEKSLGMVLDNANSVVKHEGEKVWIDPNETPAAEVSQ